MCLKISNLGSLGFINQTGGNGGPTATFPGAGQLAWLDLPSVNKLVSAPFLYFPYFSFWCAGNGGAAQAGLYICPESERGTAPLATTGANGGGPQTSNTGLNFVGVLVAYSNQNVNVKDDMSILLGAMPSEGLIIPVGYYLKLVKHPVASADAGAVVGFRGFYVGLDACGNSQ